VSSGSACASNSTHKASRALVAFGVSEDEADTSIRISLSPENTKEEANALISALSDALSRLARKS
jgi:cysteine desulfurase